VAATGDVLIVDQLAAWARGFERVIEETLPAERDVPAELAEAVRYAVQGAASASAPSW